MLEKRRDRKSLLVKVKERVKTTITKRDKKKWLSVPMYQLKTGNGKERKRKKSKLKTKLIEKEDSQ